MPSGLDFWAPRGTIPPPFISPMLSKRGSCLHPHLGLERETLNLDDGPGDTEAQGAARGFAPESLSRVLQSWPPRHCLDLMLSGGEGVKLAL